MKLDMANEELRYLEYFGLGYNPFPVAPDNENFYISEHIDQILTELVHGIVARKGFMVLTGEIGLGKTTISRRIIDILEENEVETSLILHTFYQDVELLREINKDFGLYTDNLELSDQMKVLNDFLINQNREGKNCAIIIDDAQNLNSKSLELIRMISNLETDREKLVQILLIGQPELMNKLNSSELRQLKSRIIIKKEARPLNQDELKNYILFKLNTAGNQGRTTIATGAFRKIHKYSKGNFRGVNIFMDRCLYVAFIHNTTSIGKSIVDEAYRDLNQVEQEGGKKIYLFSLLAILILIIGGAFYLDLFPEIDWLRSNMSTREETVMRNEKRETLQLTNERLLKEKTQKERPIPDAVVNFLSAYNLSEFAIPFVKAMETGIFREVADSIFKKTGYHMIQLDTIPEHIKSRYGVLSFSLDKSGKESYFLLWRPTIRITKFYLGYRGEEIKSLEELLAGVNQYLYYIDGIVGPRLIMAVNRFQEEKGLEVSGFPDEKTIFLLCNALGAAQAVSNANITTK
ncbi:AAA family ATPase [candidate division WOR-3 bacterium]|nr:AAA family ATPase [candidate division WOR-3 bacterium]